MLEVQSTLLKECLLRGSKYSVTVLGFPITFAANEIGELLQKRSRGIDSFSHGLTRQHLTSGINTVENTSSPSSCVKKKCMIVGLEGSVY